MFLINYFLLLLYSYKLIHYYIHTSISEALAVLILVAVILASLTFLVYTYWPVHANKEVKQISMVKEHISNESRDEKAK